MQRNFPTVPKAGLWAPSEYEATYPCWQAKASFTPLVHRLKKFRLGFHFIKEAIRSNDYLSFPEGWLTMLLIAAIDYRLIFLL